ncbi:PH domain-containing protein [Chryseobacterium suipulveris]|uniref:PH domain-containing protein n=1 Tax=Chryseobacterium suipulveris TaxID=2929800 RepID=A0ABY4BSC2_9FLAO|nr:PH domain-containing protein [Chryseobacterium suipulveris]UOE40631.1 PH domain-containing protein [Chryseobacterium suipulveris]
MRKIPVKYGIEILVICLTPFLFMISESISNGKVTGILFSFGYLILVGFVIFGIRYWIENEELVIQNLLFWKTRIRISEVSKIEKTWNALSSPAPSITGRVEIYYNKKSIVISPKNFEEFKNELLRINPNIIIKE